MAGYRQYKYNTSFCRLLIIKKTKLNSTITSDCVGTELW